MALSKDEIRSLRHESQKKDKAQVNLENKPKNKNKLIIYSVSSFLIILVISIIGYGFVKSNQPGPLDNFAKCLTDKGAVMYGASFCKYTSGQKGMFGNSMKFIDYRDFTEDSNIKLTPTWKINGQYYENAQSLDRLSS